ncbi:MAG: SMC-Scp complex subunit ScpB [Acidobacteriaceae bacterium]|nr:SMC-Scp complex subunit ScpB [Acidobacteriaceae bacterium]
MSLKAKIEAVIYAAEEPVTLAQLVGLLGQEAQAELDRAVSAQQSFLLDEPESASDALSEADVEAMSKLDSSPIDAAAGPDNAPSAPAPTTEEVSADVVESVSAEQAEAEAQANAARDAATMAAVARAERMRAAKLRAHFRTLLDELIAEYSTSDRGLEIREVAGGFRFATKPEYHDAVRGFVRSLKPPLKLTLQALETLAVVAYKQPVTAPEISEIRGVDSGGVLGSLMARKLITTAGRKQVIGRPILYKTTREFLLKFGLRDVAELPSIEEFEKMAGQLAEQEEIVMAEHEQPESSSPESSDEQPVRDAYAPLVENDLAPADNVSDETGDKASIDGRLSSLPPNYDAVTDDPSAVEAEIQAGADPEDEDQGGVAS